MHLCYLLSILLVLVVCHLTNVEARSSGGSRGSSGSRSSSQSSGRGSSGGQSSGRSSGRGWGGGGGWRSSSSHRYRGSSGSGGGFWSWLFGSEDTVTHAPYQPPPRITEAPWTTPPPVDFAGVETTYRNGSGAGSESSAIKIKEALLTNTNSITGINTRNGKKLVSIATLLFHGSTMYFFGPSNFAHRMNGMPFCYARLDASDPLLGNVYFGELWGGGPVKHRATQLAWQCYAFNNEECCGIECCPKADVPV